jgi:hypothetical protein
VAVPTASHCSDAAIAVIVPPASLSATCELQRILRVELDPS